MRDEGHFEDEMSEVLFGKPQRWNSFRFRKAHSVLVQRLSNAVQFIARHRPSLTHTRPSSAVWTEPGQFQRVLLYTNR